MTKHYLTKQTSSSIAPFKKARLIPSISSVLLIGSFAMMAFSGFSFLLLFIAIGSLLTGISSFIYHHIKEERYLPKNNKLTNKPPAPLKRQLNRCKLHDSLKMDREIDNALDQLSNKQKKSIEFSKLLSSKFNPGELSWNRFDGVSTSLNGLIEKNIQEFINLIERASHIEDQDLKNELLKKGSQGLIENTKALHAFEKLFVSLSTLSNKEEGNSDINALMKELESLITRSTKYK